MSEIYEKIGSGINKIQGSLQSSQAVSMHKKAIQEAGLKRSEILIQLGEELYKKYRNGEFESSELGKKVEALKEFDRKIYEAKQAIAKLQAESTDHHCPNCGVKVTVDDKFCGSCGTKLELYTQEEVTETKVCSSCEEEIPFDAAFCSCCGTKLS